MVVTSYGGLIPGQSEQDFFSCSSMPRNRELMRVFKDVGLVEQLGSGMSRILKVYDRSIFNISEHFIKVEFPFSVSDVNPNIVNSNETVNYNSVLTVSSSDDNSNIANNNEIGNDNGNENSVLNTLKNEPAITAKRMAEVMNVSARKIAVLLNSLKRVEK